jgi:outer membrane protein TolC
MRTHRKISSWKTLTLAALFGGLAAVFVAAGLFAGGAVALAEENIAPPAPLTLEAAARLTLESGPQRAEVKLAGDRARAGVDLAQSAFRWHAGVGTARIPQLVELAEQFGGALGDLRTQVGLLAQNVRRPVTPTISSPGLTGMVYDTATGHRWAVLPALSAARTFPTGGQLLLATHWGAFGPLGEGSAQGSAETQWQPFKRAPLAQFTQPLFRDPATLEPGLRRDEAQRNAAREEASARLTETRALLDLTQTYFALSQAQDEVEAAGRALGQAQTEARVRQDKAWKGDATGLDLQEADVLVQRAAARVEAARHAAEAARQRLNRLLGRPFEAPLAVAPPTAPPPGAPEPSPAEALTEALAHRAELDLARRGVESARAQLTAAREASRAQATASASVAADQSWSVGFDVQWPFYDGGSGRAQVAQGEAGLALAEKSVADRQDDVALQLTQARYARQDAARAFQVAELVLERARQAAAKARERLGQGAAVAREVTAADDALFEAESGRRAALYRWYQAEWAWLAALGRLDESVRAGR